MTSGETPKTTIIGVVISTRTKQRQAKHKQPGRSGEDPRLAGLPMLRTSERGVFKRCRWKWWNEFEETLHPKTDIPPLRFGTLIHKSLADYYIPGKKRGPHPAQRFEIYYNEELRTQEQFGFKVVDLEGDAKWTEAGELGIAMLNHYVEHYGADQQWEVIVTEQPFRQLIYKPLTKTPWFWYVGIIDGIWRNRSTHKLSIVDHKTAAAIQLQYLSLDSQATGYWTWGLDWIYEQGLLKPDEKPAGMLYNHLRKQFPDERPFELHNGRKVFLNLDGSPSGKQPAPYFVRTPIYRDFHERESVRRQVLFEMLDMERVRRAGRGATEPPDLAYKNQGQFTCPGCWCFDFCELHEAGHDWLEMREFAASKWNPYSEHEIYIGDTSR